MDECAKNIHKTHDPQTPGQDEKDPGSTKPPKTSDSGAAFAVTALMAVSALGIGMVFASKKRRCGR